MGKSRERGRERKRYTEQRTRGCENGWRGMERKRRDGGKAERAGEVRVEFEMSFRAADPLPGAINMPPHR